MSEGRTLIKLQFKEALEEFLSESHTPDAVKISLISGIFSWMSGNTAPTLAREASLELREAYSIQGKIGWGQFIRGRIAIQWSGLIAFHLTCQAKATNPYTKKKAMEKMTAERWGTRLISIVYDYVLRLWDRRNIDEHGATSEEETSTKRRKLLLEAKSMRETGCVAYQDCCWLFIPQKTLESYSNLSLSSWIRNARTLIRINRDQEKSAAVSIHRHFDPGPGTVPPISYITPVRREATISITFKRPTGLV
jgi:hypothetical protein